jgi:hypothetical protein
LAREQGVNTPQPTDRDQAIANDLNERGYPLPIAPIDLGGASNVSEWIQTNLLQRYPGHFLFTSFLKEVVSGWRVRDSMHYCMQYQHSLGSQGRIPSDGP